MNTPQKTKRQYLLSVLAKSTLKNIQDCWAQLKLSPKYTFLKAPEIGMAMIRAKAGGAGQPFNMGEMTVTRSVIQLNTQQMGYGYIAGRDKEKSTLVAIIDACFQVEQWAMLIDEKLLRPLDQLLQHQHVEQQEKVNQTKVDFFTMVRGE